MIRSLPCESNIAFKSVFPLQVREETGKTFYSKWKNLLQINTDFSSTVGSSTTKHSVVFFSLLIECAHGDI